MGNLTDSSELRLIVDANVFISYLINSASRRGTIGKVVRMAIGGNFDLTVPAELVAELRRASHRRKVSRWISAERVEGFLQEMLALAGQVVDPSAASVSIPEQDPKDRYLIEAAFEHDVDILVSGGKHLLGRRGVVDRPRIMSPADFVAEFGESAR